MVDRPTRGAARPAARPAARAAAPARGTASRGAPARGAPARGAKPAATGRGFIRGAAGRSKTDDEIHKAEQRREKARNGIRMPFRFWMPPNTQGRQIIVLDDAPDFFMYEHQYQNATGDREYIGCVKEFDNCPACESLKKEGTYCLFLSVIDTEPYNNKAGDEVPFSRKLYVVKPGQQKKFFREYERQGTLRGAVFDLARDGDQDPITGNDVAFVEFAAEEELADYQRFWTDREGKEQSEDCSVPYVYEELFDEPSTEALRAIFGGAPTPGSRAANREVMQEEEYVEDGSGVPWEGDEAAEEVVEEAPPARGARRGAPAPTRGAPTARTARRAPAEEAVEEVVEEEEPPAPRRAAPRTATRPAAPARNVPSRSAVRAPVRRGR